MQAARLSAQRERERRLADVATATWVA